MYAGMHISCCTVCTTNNAMSMPRSCCTVCTTINIICMHRSCCTVCTTINAICMPRSICTVCTTINAICMPKSCCTVWWATKDFCLHFIASFSRSKIRKIKKISFSSIQWFKKMCGLLFFLIGSQGKFFIWRD